MAIVTAAVSPELPQDILMDIFALLEIPDLVRAGSLSLLALRQHHPTRPREIQTVADAMPALHFRTCWRERRLPL